ncbi:MAG: carbohydrate ABC transporter permease [Vicinamibacterales bacterium]
MTPRSRRLGGHALTALTWLLGFLFFLPIAWVLLSSFKPERLAVTNPPTVMFTPTLDNFRAVVHGVQFSLAFQNSVIVTVCSTIVSVTLAFPIAYALTIRPVRKSKDILFFLISTRMLPVAGVIVPIFMLAKSLDALDSLWVLIWLYGVMNVPLAVWMLRAYLNDVPREVIEAAAVDGATNIQVASRIVIPMVVPSLAAIATLCAVFAWSEFFIGVSLTSYDAATLPVYLTSFMSDRGLYWGELSAVVVITILPVLIPGLFIQKPLMKGFSKSDAK